MEKYGVQQDSEFAKTAKAGNQNCPSCGRQMQAKGAVLWCPSCGTKPLERDDGKKGVGAK